MSRNSNKYSEFSYFRLTLLYHLEAIHSEKIEDETFISERCEEAEEAYEIYIHQGDNLSVALEKARSVLFEGLATSRYLLLTEIIANEFPEFPEEERSNFIKRVLPACQHIFRQYPELTEFSTQYKELYSELVNIISQAKI